MIDPLRERRPITGARTALSGYQKGHCFYCFDGFPLLGSPPPDIDHFFPHSLKSVGFKGVDSVWNLVLACRRCNRGSNGKFNRVPSLRLLKRLNTRNEFLIESHHPLRETLIAQTGANATERRDFLVLITGVPWEHCFTSGNPQKSQRRSSRSRDCPAAHAKTTARIAVITV